MHSIILESQISELVVCSWKHKSNKTLHNTVSVTFLMILNTHHVANKQCHNSFHSMLIKRAAILNCELSRPKIPTLRGSFLRTQSVVKKF